jgi:xanthine dehydrogenase YagS FAD-binding subunit
MLAAAPIDASIFRRAAEAALAEAKPSGDNGFKIELARRIIVRAIALAAAGTPEQMPALPGSPFATVSGVIHG